jgi:hypothetical protein
MADLEGMVTGHQKTPVEKFDQCKNECADSLT